MSCSIRHLCCWNWTSFRRHSENNCKYLQESITIVAAETHFLCVLSCPSNHQFNRSFINSNTHHRACNWRCFRASEFPPTPNVVVCEEMCKHTFWGARGHGIVFDGVNHMEILCRAISPMIVCGDETHISNPSASTWGGFCGFCSRIRSSRIPLRRKPCSIARSCWEHGKLRRTAIPHLLDKILSLLSTRKPGNNQTSQTLPQRQPCR